LHRRAAGAQRAAVGLSAAFNDAVWALREFSAVVQSIQVTEKAAGRADPFAEE
jgi:hypothetical protein